MVEHAEGLDPQTRAKAAFYTRLISSAMSPSNFVATNPELLRATLEARGGNLVRGMEMLAEDLSAGGGTLKIRQTDESKFQLGVDMATTPGKVILRNEVMELIQYAPTTERGLRAPAADRSALDQQILRARSQPRKKLRALGGGSGVDGVRHLLGQSGREPGGPRLRSLYARGRARRARRDRDERPAKAKSRRRAIASAARCSPRRWPIWRPSATSASTA